MKIIFKTILSFTYDESGATAIEYAILAAAVAAVIVPVVYAIGVKVITAFESADSIWL